MKNFILSSAEMEELSVYEKCVNSTDIKYAHSYCPGCSDSGCTGSAQYGCSSCSSCAAWQKGKGG